MSKYDIILFGVTGFTGKLAAEYLIQKNYGIKWAVSARNAAKAEEFLKTLTLPEGVSLPDVLVANLICDTPEDTDTLRKVVEQTKVVLTCSGPFEKYGQTLVQLCAELGVSYADITGETDFLRLNIDKHDAKAQETGAVILSHCGHDCIPCDLMVWELDQFAKTKGCELQKVMTYEAFAEEAAFSGGTVTTAAFQLSKDRAKGKTSFDPLLKATDGSKSEYNTKNVCPKSAVSVPAMPGRKAGPWIMAPVMTNCVRRSNALIGYAKELQYGDSKVMVESWSAWAKNNAMTLLIGAAVSVPSVFGGFLPKAGEGPSREDMENGFLKLHATATAVSKSNPSETKELEGLFQFNKDTSYLYTAALLVETGTLLVEKKGVIAGGCKTPASALGGDLTQRILKEMDVSLTIKEVE
eukprot:Nitzschia sp. Nitz4//scaffold209_size42451//9844//11318//NITZ4_007355-RA/size42451-processed-gene-0.57-mRNA-1//1//CDS//3329541691//3036//frame0